ncbi:MAG: ferredoxin [Planctomycetota bacterium]
MDTDSSERTFGGLTVRIDRDQCISTANCMRLAEEVFDFDGEDICVFKKDAPTIDRERLLEACRVCPVDALTVLDDTGQQLVP